MTTPSPWTIGIRVFNAQADSCGTDHVCIDVGSDYEHTPNSTFTAPEVIAAYHWAAGIIGRLAADLSRAIHEASANHQCARIPDRFVHGCVIEGTGFIKPHKDLAIGPCVGFTVPRSQEKHWVQLIQQKLNAMLTAGPGQTRANDQSSESNHGHIDAPRRPEVKVPR